MDFIEVYVDMCFMVGFVVREGNVKVLRKLFKKGWSVDVVDNRGWMLIYEVVYYNFVECL